MARSLIKPGTFGGGGVVVELARGGSPIRLEQGKELKLELKLAEFSEGELRATIRMVVSGHNVDGEPILSIDVTHIARPMDPCELESQNEDETWDEPLFD